MRTTAEVTIKGRTFKVGMMPCTRQLKLLPTLTDVVFGTAGKAGPLFVSVFSGGGNTNIADLEKTLPSLTDLGAYIAQKLPGDQLEALTKELLALTLVKPLAGGPEQPLLPILDEEMAGETFALFELLWFAIKLNYSDFGQGLIALVRKTMQAGIQSASQSKG